MKKQFLLALCIFLFVSVAAVTAQSAEIQNVTREEAAAALDEINESLQELQALGLNVVFIQDALLESTLYYKENTTESFQVVIARAGLIQARHAQAIQLQDNLRALELKLEEYAELGVDTSPGTARYVEARTSFTEERYDEAEVFVAEADAILEESRAELTTLNAIQNAGRTFVQRQWKSLVVSIIVTVLGSILLWKVTTRLRAKRTLDLLKLEVQTLESLMKKAQVGRFQTKKLSQQLYKIRIDKYREKLAKVKREIPVYEAIVRGKRPRKAAKAK